MKIAKTLIPLDFEDPFWTNNFSNLRDYVYIQNGGGAVRVELTQKHINSAIHDAVSKYLAYYRQDYYVRICPIVADQYVDLPPDIAPDLVKDVIFQEINETSTVSYETFAPFPFMIPIMGGGVTAYNMNLGEYIMYRQRLEDVTKALGFDKHWEWINGRIKVYPTAASSTDSVGIMYGQIPTPDELESDDWIRDFAVAKAKYLLGTIRGKFSGFNAAGGQASTDGEALKQEATAAMDKLLEKIDKAQPGVGMFQF